MRKNCGNLTYQMKSFEGEIQCFNMVTEFGTAQIFVLPITLLVLVNQQILT